MQKILLSFLAAFTIAFANAQDGSSDREYKQYAGARNIEVQFTPFGALPVSIRGLRFRYFPSDDLAVRMSAFLGVKTDTEVRNMTNSNGEDILLKDVSSSFDIEVRPGFEMHFSKTNRLSPYYGAEVIIGLRTSALKSETLDSDGISVVMDKIRNPENDGYFRLGANVVLGADFYFSEHIYAGTEVGFGLQLNLEHDAVSVPNEGEKTVLSEGGSSFELGPDAVGQIRLGFLF